MHDIRAIRADPAAFDAALARRRMGAQSPALLAADAALRATLTELQEGQARRNDASRAIGAAKGRGDEPEAARLMAEVAALKDALPALEERQRGEEAALDDLLLALPNLPADDVPDGADATGNVVVGGGNEPRAFDFVAEEHDVLGQRLGYDPDAAAALSGARFAVLKGGLARLHRALGQFMLDLHTAEHGYTEVNPPLIVNSKAMTGTGQLPKFSDDLFKAMIDRPEKKNYRRGWLIPTAEVSLTNLVRERILADTDLPLRFTALTPCFRAEAGAAGRDTRGLIRQHQFEKVELVSIAHPEAAADEHERMTCAAETVLERLGLTWRRMLLCAGDMGFAARKTYDLEVWLPGQGAWREISSCSDCGDFQARRMGARLKAAGEKGTRFVHTLNGSGVAVGRALVAVLETFQNADGSVTVPGPLRPYMAGVARLDPA
jgi:seryl-tRNA synthetase